MSATVTSYNFKHPARINKEQLRMLESLHDNFALYLSGTISSTMRTVVEVETAFVDQMTYAEFIQSLSNPSMSYQFTLEPTRGQAILDIAMPLVFAFVDRLFGGKGASQGAEPRQVTPIEIGVVNRIIKRVIENLEAIWEPVLHVELTDIELETNPEYMQVTAANEIVVLLAFDVNAPNASGRVSLCYPFFTIESILSRLSRQKHAPKGDVDLEELIRQNRLRLAGAKLPLEVEMGRGQISVEALKQIQVGDVLKSETRQSDPCVVYVGDKPKFHARPFVTENGEINLQVIGRISPSRYSDYIDA
jgi:flagellar motor switch protein FliM